MAARLDAAALSSPFRCFFLVFLYINLFFNCNVSWANLVYSRQDLIRIGFRAEQAVNKDFIHSNGIRSSVPVTDYSYRRTIYRTKYRGHRGLHGLLSALRSCDDGGGSGNKREDVEPVCLQG